MPPCFRRPFTGQFSVSVQGFHCQCGTLLRDNRQNFFLNLNSIFLMSCCPLHVRLLLRSVSYFLVLFVGFFFFGWIYCCFFFVLSTLGFSDSLYQTRVPSQYTVFIHSCRGIYSTVLLWLSMTCLSPLYMASCMALQC